MRKTDTVREFIRHGAIVFAGLIAANVLTYVFYASVSRAVGVEAAGLFTSLISAMLILALPGTVAATIVAKRVADAWASGQPGISVAIARRIGVAVVPAGLLVAALFAAAGSAIARFFHTGDTLLLLLASAGFVLTLLLPPQRAVLQGRSDFRGFSASNIVEGVGKAASGLIAVRFGGGLRLALGGYLIAVAAAFGLNAWLTMRGDSANLVRSKSGLARSLRRIALPIAAITAMTFVDVVLARHFLPSYDAGLYGAAALAGRAMLTVIAFVPTVLLPKAVARVRSGQGAASLLAAALGVTVVVIGTMLVVVAAVPARIVTVVAGGAFAGASVFMLPYAAAMASLAGVVVLSTYLIGIDRHGFALPLAAVALAEIIAMLTWHQTAGSFLVIIIAGHSAALACCAADTIMSLVRPASPTISAAGGATE